MDYDTGQRGPKQAQTRTLRYSDPRDVACRRYDALMRMAPRWCVYNTMPGVRITDPDAQPTTETRRQADLLFDRIKQAPCFGRYKEHAKRAFWHSVLHAAKRAGYLGGCVKVPRDLHHPECSKARLQVIDAAVGAGFFVEHRSRPGSPKMSRLVPTRELIGHGTVDPWTFEPDARKQLVFVRERGTKKELPFDTGHPVAADVQRRLELVNQVNGLFKITYECWNYWEEEFTRRRRLRPVHYAVFNGDFEHGGRLYTGRYGHQGLRKVERLSICFDGEPSVELDYGGMHPRMLYHLEGIDYRGDPYALWGRATTRPMRLMAKRLVNALINARSHAAAISACNRAMSTRTKDGQGKKRGKALDDARRLNEAARETGLKFAEILPLVLRAHAPIAHHFGGDMGVRLMRIESAIALDVLTYFASLGAPCLGNHDSFIVPRSQKRVLKRQMRTQYEARLDYSVVSLKTSQFGAVGVPRWRQGVEGQGHRPLR